jgi:RNA polymerase sigma-70 factor (ECF subfamily)
MPLKPSEGVHFDSWKELLAWLPKASESQLLTVFVWASEIKNVPAIEERRLAQARKDAFEFLVQRTREPLTRFLVRRHHCRDAHLAEDVVQEVLLQVYRRAEQFDPQRSFWGWLYRIARNKYIDTLRRLRPGEVGAGWSGEADEALEDWLQKMSMTAPSAEATALAKERQQRLEEALGRLPETQQTIFRLKREGIKGTEIAQRIGKSQAYVSQAFHESLELLRDWMEE